MRNNVLLAISLFLSAFATAQKAKTYWVEYFNKQESPITLPNEGKVNFTVIYTDSSNKEVTDTVPGTLDFNSFKFEALTFIIANDDSSKTFFATIKNSKENVGVVMNTPDTIYYSRKGMWTKVTDGKIEPIVSRSISVAETNEKKNILGYECIKFVSVDTDTEIIFWASKQLPCTLLPYTGLKQFKYGILEIEDPQTKSHTKATKIKIL